MNKTAFTTIILIVMIGMIGSSCFLLFRAPSAAPSVAVLSVIVSFIVSAMVGRLPVEEEEEEEEELSEEQKQNRKSLRRDFWIIYGGVLIAFAFMTYHATLALAPNGGIPLVGIALMSVVGPYALGTLESGLNYYFFEGCLD